MSGHTPGPWSYGWETEAHDWAIVTDRAHSIIANVNTESGPNAASIPATQVMPADANARLIAAAPDLLASVVELLEPLVRAASELQAQGKVLDEYAQGAFDRANAALRLARGEA